MPDITHEAELSFRVLDDLAFAASTSPSCMAGIRPATYGFGSLGPLMELIHLVSSKMLPNHALNWIEIAGSEAAFVSALHRNKPQWLSDNLRLGFIRVRPTSESWFNMSTDFLMKAKKAAQEVARLPGNVPGQMAAALQELEGNMQEHSEAPSTGVLAFRAAESTFEFIAADHGIGLLRSLQRNPLFASMNDHGKSLMMALRDGVSRFQERGRGHGFRPLFLGLTNRNGYLRFRTGDHAIIMDGTNPQLATAQLSQKPHLVGFFASVRCEDTACNR